MVYWVDEGQTRLLVKEVALQRQTLQVWKQPKQSGHEAEERFTAKNNTSDDWGRDILWNVGQKLCIVTVARPRRLHDNKQHCMSVTKKGKVFPLLN
jgi:hypothetical protein